MIHKKVFLAAVVLLTAGLLLSGCQAFKRGGPVMLQGANTGTVTTGKTVTAVTTSVSPAGGSVSVTDPNSPLNGLEITVPPASYSSDTPFNVSYAPVEKHTFGDMFNPITPMITIDNGGKYSEEIMQVKVPVTVPAGQFAMGFFYDDRTGQLEGLPVLAQDASSITVATRHFSKIIFASTPEDALFQRGIETGFHPGVDDWEFTNYGSYIAQGGHCAGQSVGAMWYFTARPDGQNVSLWGRYDNNGDKPATPKFWLDDSLGYRFSSVLQADMNFDSYNRGFAYQLAKNPKRTWELFNYSMQLTHSPDLVFIFNYREGSGHALVVYKISGNRLYVADPNYPGRTDRYIEYSNGRFIPYNSGANATAIAAGKGKEYDVIAYAGITATIDWGKVARRWAEVQNKTIGNDYFPSYEVQRLDDLDGWVKLEDGYKSADKMLSIRVTSDTGKDLFFDVTRDGYLVKEVTQSGEPGYELKPGNNHLGIYVWGYGPGPDADEYYIDFKYFDVNYKATSESDSTGCFIATAAYGTPQAEEINILRQFRDEFLLKHYLGRRFVDTYYATSPPVADFISRHELLRTAVREYFVSPIVAVVESTRGLWSRGSDN